MIAHFVKSTAHSTFCNNRLKGGPTIEDRGNSFVPDPYIQRRAYQFIYVPQNRRLITASKITASRRLRRYNQRPRRARSIVRWG
jgi:hypothetical protein